MWLLHFLPDSLLELIIRGIVIIGAISLGLGMITKWVPFFGPRAFILRAVGVLLLVPGMYFWGGYGVEMEYRAAAEAWKAKIEILEAKSQQENRQIEQSVIKETKVIREDTEETKYLIEQMKQQINKQGCELSPEVIDLYNEGMTGR